MTAVSVIVVTFQRPLRLWRALESVGQQTYSEVELIVVNNGGTSVDELLERYEQTFQRPIQGINLRTACTLAAARNVGVAAAKGEILALLDDDDRYRPGHLEQLMQAFEQNADAVVAYSDALLMIEEGTNANDEPDIVATCRFGLPYEKQRFDQDNYVVTSALAMRRAAFQTCGGFNPSLSCLEDWEILLRLRNLGDLLYVPGDIGAEYSVRLGSGDHMGAVFDEERQALLDWLSARYDLPPLVPKTFYDVACDFACETVPVK